MKRTVSLFFLLAQETIIDNDLPALYLSVLFNREIAVGSFLIASVQESEVVKTLVFVCCNASQKHPPIGSRYNLFWAELTNSGVSVSPAIEPS